MFIQIKSVLNKRNECYLRDCLTLADVVHVILEDGENTSLDVEYFGRVLA